MKTTVMTLLAMPILTTLLILGMTSQAIAADNRDVLIMTCSSGPMPMGPLQVVGVDRSAGANDVPILVADPFDPMAMGENCAQALANLLNAGFTISNSQGDFTLIYTLTRTGH
jgi:hypothetical protein